MQQSEIKTIDVNCLEWFDKINGNSYFAGTVLINYGMENAESFHLPFQYGYGSQYEHEANKQLIERGYFPEKTTCLWRYCEENKIIYRHNLITNCRKRELKTIDRLIESKSV